MGAVVVEALRRHPCLGVGFGVGVGARVGVGGVRCERVVDRLEELRLLVLLHALCRGDGARFFGFEPGAGEAGLRAPRREDGDEACLGGGGGFARVGTTWVSQKEREPLPEDASPRRSSRRRGRAFKRTPAPVS